ncbi:MAG: hormogonium polysaccharide secretion pseudopilin HpsB [Calothrix sp. MO_192.B10]|nr:hormogonium polysaccharide secretion pseudopilin HpsB [Calothrix sp. MO_192.B10]
MKFKHDQISPRPRESGFTILESLVAVVVVAVLMAAIAPAIVLSAAIRVQSRRVELATQAAKTYIDGVRAKQIVSPLETGSNTTPSDFAAPTPSNSLNCKANSYCTSTDSSTTPTNLYCIDLDSLPTISDPKCEASSSQDMVLQVFRYNPNNSNSNDDKAGYYLGVRVYRADGFRNDGSLTKAPAKQGTVTGGLGDRKAPLVELTTEISSQTDSFNQLCDRLKTGNSNTNNSCT